MSHGNHRGPENTGPKSGRGQGYCGGHGHAGHEDHDHGGHGHRHMRNKTGLPGWLRNAGNPEAGCGDVTAAALRGVSDLELLKRQSQMLANAKSAIDERIQELEAKA